MTPTTDLAALLHLFTCGDRPEHGYDFDEQNQRRPLCMSAAARLHAAGVRVTGDAAPLLDVRHEEDGSWSVSVRAMPGHVGCADTLDQAYVEAHDAALVWVETVRVTGEAALREAAQAFIDWYDSPGRSYQRDGRGNAAIDALRAALATEEQP